MLGRSARGQGAGRAVLVSVVATALLLSPGPPVLAGGSVPAGDAPVRAPGDLAVTAWRDELPQESVNAILQARDGHLWLGTYEGLVRFDGIRFSVFDSRNVPIMKRPAILSLAEDADGGLFIGTQRGGLLRMKDGRFESWTTSQGLSSDEVFALLVDRWNGLWIGTGRGVNRLSSGRIQSFSAASGAPTEPVVSLTETPDGTVWAGSNGGGLRCVRAGEWRVAPEGGLANPFVSSVKHDGTGGLWIGSRDGLHHLVGGVLRSWGPAEGLVNPLVSALVVDRTGDVWIGTHGSGLVRFRDGRFEARRQADARATDYVRSLLSDREGNLWAGTRGGLLRLRDGAFAAYHPHDGLVGEIVRTVFQDSRGRILVGTEGGGVQAVDGRRITRVRDPTGISERLIRSIGEDATGALFIGTAGDGLLRLKDGQVRQYLRKDGLPGNDVRVVLGRPDGSVWVGTTTGLSALRAGRWTPPDPLLATTGVCALLARRDGSTAVGTIDRGVVILGADGRRRAVGGAEGLAADPVLALHEDPQGGLWIGSSNGLSRWKDEKLTTFRQREALSGEQIFSILEDDGGFLFMSNNKGVHRIARSALEAVARGASQGLSRITFGPEDGMPGRQCNGTSQPAAWRSRDGRLWYPTTHGLAVVDPTRLGRNPTSPPVLIQRVLVDGEPATSLTSLELQPGSRRIEIEYEGLRLSAPERVTFRHRLVGLDTGWHETTRRSVEFTTLPPGVYRFEVAAAADGGSYGGTPARVEIRVVPRLHQTRLFWSLLGAVAAGAVWTAFRRLKAQERRLNAVVADKTRALAAEMRRVDEANRQLAESNVLLEELSRSDPLTGLANRRQLDEALDTEWRRCGRLGLPLAVVLFDLDHFKDFNDTFGHKAGDDCLRQVASVLSAGIRRAGDVVARYGGEEFLALLPGTGEREAEELAQQVRVAVEALGIPHVVPPGRVTISGGVASLVPESERPEDLTNVADEALYEAKRQGRNRIVRARSSHSVSGPIRVAPGPAPSGGRSGSRKTD